MGPTLKFEERFSKKQNSFPEVLSGDIYILGLKPSLGVGAGKQRLGIANKQKVVQHRVYIPTQLQLADSEWWPMNYMEHSSSS